MAIPDVFGRLLDEEFLSSGSRMLTDKGDHRIVEVARWEWL